MVPTRNEPDRQRIAARCDELRQRIAQAAQTAGRDPAEITLVAVTKYVGLADTRACVEAGCLALGESRPQQLWEKAAGLEDCPQVEWHLIGHLQRNKVRRTLPVVGLIHSVDSRRLLQMLDEQAASLGGRARALLEVNISGDEAKHGFAPDELEPVLAELAAYQHVAIEGLMTMASATGGLAAAGRNFANLRELRNRLVGNCPTGMSLDTLSMGMSRDFEVAIREGSTLVRVGSSLFT